MENTVKEILKQMSYDASLMEFEAWVQQIERDYEDMKHTAPGRKVLEDYYTSIPARNLRISCGKYPFCNNCEIPTGYCEKWIERKLSEEK